MLTTLPAGWTADRLIAWNALMDAVVQYEAFQQAVLQLGVKNPAILQLGTDVGKLVTDVLAPAVLAA